MVVILASEPAAKVIVVRHGSCRAETALRTIPPVDSEVPPVANAPSLAEFALKLVKASYYGWLPSLEGLDAV